MRVTEWITIREWAKSIGRSRHTAIHWARAGRIRIDGHEGAICFGGHAWMVDPGAKVPLDLRIGGHREGAGRPKGSKSAKNMVLEG